MERIMTGLRCILHKPTFEEIAAMNKRQRWDLEWKRFGLDSDCARFFVKDVVGKHVLEIGCGNAYRSKLAEEVEDYVGIDVSKRAIKKANKYNKGTDYVCAEAEHLPFKEDAFEKVVAVQTASLIGRTLPEALREAARVAKGEVSFDIDHNEIELLYQNKLVEDLAYGSIFINQKGERIALSDEKLVPLLNKSNMSPKKIAVLTCSDMEELGVCHCCTPERPNTKSTILITAIRKH